MQIVSTGSTRTDKEEKQCSLRTFSFHSSSVRPEFIEGLFTRAQPNGKKKEVLDSTHLLLIRIRSAALKPSNQCRGS
jgi:hypothetical protein